MPSAKDRAKATGDTHLPEIEPDQFDTHQPRPTGAGVPGSRTRASRRSVSGLKDRDAPTSESPGDTRSSAEG
jgi:hypothetical protein